jgi:LacI family transcriptional regulator, galactose operon repressor
MREVADVAGVAMSSVSRVLSGHPDVSEGMRRRVMAAVETLGYTPDMLAQSLRRRATLSIGFVAGDISNPLMASIVKGAERELRRRQYSMLLMNSEGDADRDAEHIRLFEQRRVDGLMLSLAREDHPSTLAALAGTDTPRVLVDRHLPAGANASGVLSDHRSGMRAAVGHLLDLGHRRIGLILGRPVRPARERLSGLEDAYSERGLPGTFTVSEGVLSPEHGRDATRRLLDVEEPPTAIITGGNQLLAGTLEELRERSLLVGADISIVSCDTISTTELHQPPIAVVRRDTVELGRRAAELLLRRLEGAAAPETVTLPTEFVARASCATPRTGR